MALSTKMKRLLRNALNSYDQGLVLWNQINTNITNIAANTAGLGTGAIDTAQLADDAVDNDKLADDAVDSDQIADEAVTEAKLSNAGVDGLHARRIARATYDFSVDGGAVGDIALGVTIPDNAIITNVIIDIITGMTSAGGSGTIALKSEGAGDLLAAVDADTLSGLVAGIPVGTAATSIKMTDDRELTATVAVEDLTAGKFVVFVEYMLSE